MATLDEGVLQSVINSNFKTLAEQVASNVASHQQRLQLLAESSLGQILNRMNSVDPLEARALSTLSRSAQPAEAQANALAAALSQILTKAGQTTPPVTAPPPATGG